MAYKLGLLLSLVFVMSVLLFGADLGAVNVLYSTLDSIALVAAQKIESEGALTQNVVRYVEGEGASIRCLSNCSPRLGDTLDFAVYKVYSPFVLSKSSMTVSVKRSVVVGYYKGI